MARAFSPLKGRMRTALKARACSPLKARACSPLKVRVCSPLKAWTNSYLKATTWSPLKARTGSPLHAVATCPFAGERRRGSRVRFPKEKRCAESPPTFICGKRRKNRRKSVKMKVLSSGVIFTLEEGISTSYVCHERQQPYF